MDSAARFHRAAAFGEPAPSSRLPERVLGEGFRARELANIAWSCAVLRRAGEATAGTLGRPLSSSEPCAALPRLEARCDEKL